MGGLPALVPLEGRVGFDLYVYCSDLSHTPYVYCSIWHVMIRAVGVYEIYHCTALGPCRIRHMTPTAAAADGCVCMGQGPGQGSLVGLASTCLAAFLHGRQIQQPHEHGFVWDPAEWPSVCSLLDMFDGTCCIRDCKM